MRLADPVTITVLPLRDSIIVITPSAPHALPLLRRERPTTGGSGSRPRTFAIAQTIAVVELSSPAHAPIVLGL